MRCSLLSAPDDGPPHLPAADHGPFGTTSDAASNPFRGWTSPGASCARPAPFHAPRSEASAEAFAGFSAGLLPEQRPVPVQQSVPAPGLGSRRPVGVTQQPVGMTPGRKDGKLRESKSSRRKNSTASHKEVAQGESFFLARDTAGQNPRESSRKAAVYSWVGAGLKPKQKQSSESSLEPTTFCVDDQIVS